MEDGKPQRITGFQEQRSDNKPKPTPLALNLPKNVFTNYASRSDTGALTVLLFDSLNTDRQHLTYAKQELLNFLKTLPPGKRIALFTSGQSVANGAELYRRYRRYDRSSSEVVEFAPSYILQRRGDVRFHRRAQRIWHLENSRGLSCGGRIHGGRIPGTFGDALPGYSRCTETTGTRPGGGAGSQEPDLDIGWIPVRHYQQRAAIGESRHASGCDPDCRVSRRCSRSGNNERRGIHPGLGTLRTDTNPTTPLPARTRRI